MKIGFFPLALVIFFLISLSHSQDKLPSMHAGNNPLPKVSSLEDTFFSLQSSEMQPNYSPRHVRFCKVGAVARRSPTFSHREIRLQFAVDEKSDPK